MYVLGRIKEERTRTALNPSAEVDAVHVRHSPMSGDCVVVYVRWPDHRRTLIDKCVRRPVKQCLTIHVIVRR
jgi:hypothetical protein